ncbi:phosphoribosyltransferase family protein [Brevibacillus sp. NPDC003359]|uniref:phosphoribosyltransferase family protein n=1 Tax=unclassified Brevibacillus TaxID=2684853 RepID=UPI003685EA90
MDTTTLSTSWQKPPRYGFNILDSLEVEVIVEKNPFDLPLELLFGMAGRINKKRGFLFVSKVLGKHIPVIPAVSLVSGALLGARFLEVYYGQQVDTAPLVQGLMNQERSQEVFQQLMQKPFELPEQVLFIGFAETATGLGHSMFSCFQNNAYYIHTTREMIQDIQPSITFEEEHSHAVAHLMYPREDHLLSTDAPIVLVDDEITTGKTALNIIREIQKKYPRSHYIVASLLDWRSDEDCQRFRELQEELNITITNVSLVKGQIKVEGAPVAKNENEEKSMVERTSNFPKIIQIDGAEWPRLSYTSMDSSDFPNQRPYLLQTGRFGMISSDQNLLNTYCEKTGIELGAYRSGKTLCMGTGEFMYIPMMIAAHMGDDVWYQSTTRSPIHPSEMEKYAVKNAFAFSSPDDPLVPNFCYNIPDNYYSDVFVFFERGTTGERLHSFYAVVNNLSIPNKYIVFFG